MKCSETLHTTVRSARTVVVGMLVGSPCEASGHRATVLRRGGSTAWSDVNTQRERAL